MTFYFETLYLSTSNLCAYDHFKACQLSGVTVQYVFSEENKKEEETSISYCYLKCKHLLIAL